MELCEHCKDKGNCPILNKAECPINTLWREEEEARATIAELEDMLKKGELK